MITEDKELVSQFKEFETMMDECAGATTDTEEVKKSKWILRFELDKESMLDKNISMDDVNFAIKTGYKNEVDCVFSDFNAKKLICRLRFNGVLDKKKKTIKPIISQKVHELDQGDEIYKLKNIQDNLLNNTILKGIKGIGKVNLRKIKSNLVKEGANYVNKEAWVLDTTGTNLLDILSMNMIDKTKTYSNDIIETYKVLGIEAARQMIYNEIVEVLEFGGSYVNSHHINLLADRMCATVKMVSIFRHGINNDNIGPLAKASFEETPEMFLRAARHGELDLMKGISANIMCGQEGICGTNSFQVLLDIDKIITLGTKKLKETVDIDKMFTMETGTDECSTNNILLNNGVDVIKKTNVGVIDDTYDPGF